jgi:hypothetical protein
MGVGRLIGRLWCAITVLVLMLGNYEVVKYGFWVLSDGPFISLLAAMLGCFSFWLATKRLVWIAVASTLLGAAISVRPSGSLLLLMLPILYAYAWRAFEQRAQTLALMIIPCTIVTFMSLVAYHQWHDSWKPNSVLGMNLLGRAAPLADGSEPSARPAWIAIVADVAAGYRDRFLRGDTWEDHALLSAPVYDLIRHKLGLLPDDPHSAFPADELDTGATADHALTALAFDIIRAHKADYIRDVAENYAALWYIPQLLSRDDAARLDRIIARQFSASDPPTERDFIPAPRPWLVVVSMHLFQLCIFLTSAFYLIALPAGLIRRHQPSVYVWFGFAGAAALHTSILVVAFINESKPRLSLDTWPLEVLLAVLTLAAASNVSYDPTIDVDQIKGGLMNKLLPTVDRML